MNPILTLVKCDWLEFAFRRWSRALTVLITSPTMNCPNCGKSLWLMKDICPFCKNAIAPETKGTPPATAAPTVASTPATPSSDREAFVTLVKCEAPAEADAIRSQLNAVGIMTILPDEA